MSASSARYLSNWRFSMSLIPKDYIHRIVKTQVKHLEVLTHELKMD